MRAGGVSTVRARSWVDRWDAQQQGYMPDREERFAALIDAVAESAGRPDPLVLDLGSGPGSLAVRLLDAIPAATVIAVDADPLLLALGQAAWAGRDGLRFADHDLRVPGWSAALGLDRPADAAVSTTALHWLAPRALASLYAEVATVLRPGGVLLNGDHLATDEEAEPTLARLERAIAERDSRRRVPPAAAATPAAATPAAATPAAATPAAAMPGETWSQWWEAAAADPALTGLFEARQARQVETAHHGSPSGRLAVHVDALRAAGFAEIGTLWQHGDNRLLCAVLPG